MSKYLKYLFLLIPFLLCDCEKRNIPAVSIIPQPANIIESGVGVFRVTGRTMIHYEKGLFTSAEFLASYCKEKYDTC